MIYIEQFNALCMICIIIMINTVYLIQTIVRKNKNESLVQIIGLLNKVCYDKIIFLKHCI